MKEHLLAGYGRADITPEESVPLTSYGDDLRRFSQGKITDLQACSVAVTDEHGDSLIFVTGDLSWAPSYLGPEVLERIERETGVPRDHVFISGTHTHDSVGCHFPDIPEVMRYREKYINGMATAAKLAMEDRMPAEVFAGSAITERMNFIKRYIMDDGSYCGDNSKGTGTCVVAHESQADPELQLVMFKREGDKDILAANFQAHPHLEGKHDKVSAQLAGAFRDEAEQRMGVHCIYWNGGAANINSKSRIKQEQRAFDDRQWAKLMLDYTEKVNLRKVKTGPVRISHTVLPANVNHTRDDVVDQAQQVVDYFNQGHTPKEAAAFAAQFDDIHSYYHAARIISNSRLPKTKDIYLQTWSFGDVAGVVLPYEMFDTTCMTVKRNSPFRKTFVCGYSWPSYVGYIPSKMGYQNGGYEVDQSTFAPGTAEQISEELLTLLDRMYEA